MSSIAKILSLNGIITVRLLIVLIFPVLLIGISPALLTDINIDTILFCAIGLSNFIALSDIINELCSTDEIDPFLFTQVIILGFMIAFCFSLLCKDVKLSESQMDIAWYCSTFPIIISIWFALKGNRKRILGFLFLAVLLISIPIWFHIISSNSEDLGAIVHLILIPSFFFFFDGVRFLIKKFKNVEFIEIKKCLRLDVGLLIVGVTTFVAGIYIDEHTKLSVEESINKQSKYFEAGSAAAILILGNYFLHTLEG